MLVTPSGDLPLVLPWEDQDSPIFGGRTVLVEGMVALAYHSSKTIHAYNVCPLIPWLSDFCLKKIVSLWHSLLLSTQPSSQTALASYPWKTGAMYIPCTDSKSQCPSSYNSSSWLCTWDWCTPTAPETRKVIAWLPAQEEVESFVTRPLGRWTWGLTHGL